MDSDSREQNVKTKDAGLTITPAVTDWNGFIVKSAFRFLQLAALTVAIGLASPAQAVTEINWWHAMSGELGKQVEKLAADFKSVPTR